MTGKFEYDVAFSFAGEDRDYVGKVAEHLRLAGMKVYYDEFETITQWGKDLAEHFDVIFRKKAKFCVWFISKPFAKKAWPTHERRSAYARALQQKSEYILPARFDSTDVPGLSPTIGHVELSQYTPEQFASLIIAKVHSPSKPSPEARPDPAAMQIGLHGTTTPAMHTTFANIESAAQRATFVWGHVRDYLNQLRFPLPLREGLFHRTEQSLIYRSGRSWSSKNSNCLETLELCTDGTLNSVLVYHWQDAGVHYFDFEDFFVHTLALFYFLPRYYTKLSIGLESLRVDISGSFPVGTVLMDTHGIVNTGMSVARYVRRGGKTEGRESISSESLHGFAAWDRVTDLLNYILNSFDTDSPQGRSFARIDETTIRSRATVFARTVGDMNKT